MKKCYYPDWEGGYIVKDRHTWDYDNRYCVMCGMSNREWMRRHAMTDVDISSVVANDETRERTDAE